MTEMARFSAADGPGLPVASRGKSTVGILSIVAAALLAGGALAIVLFATSPPLVLGQMLWLGLIVNINSNPVVAIF